MATTPKPPKLDRQVKALIDHMSLEQVEAVAAMRAPRGKPKSFADELIREIQTKAQARLDEAKAGPLPDEPDFNEETLKAIRELDSGGGTRYKSAAGMYADLGIDSAAGAPAAEPRHEARVRTASKSVMSRHRKACEKLAK